MTDAVIHICMSFYCNGKTKRKKKCEKKKKKRDNI